MVLGEGIMVWLMAYFYAALTVATLIVSTFKVGFKKYWTWKVWERPSCLDDKSLGTHGYMHLEDVRIHYIASGPEDKPLMLFVHGFPEFWYSWRHQIKEFQKDYRVVAFDMRGYNESDKPKGLAPYSRTKLIADVKQLILALGYKSCVLVSHDWGGAVAWEFSRRNPDFVDKLIVMNAPPSSVMQKLLRTDSKQRKMSWYMLFFQVPYLPELMFKVEDFKTIERVFATAKLSEEEIKAYKHVFSQPGALTPPLNFYRAAIQVDSRKSHEYDLNYSMPILLIWGCRDTALSSAIPDMVEKENPKITVKRIESGDHFVQSNEPDKVNKIMREWLEE